MSEDAAQTFSDVAIDHARKPRHFGPLARYNGCARRTGPCGDTMVFWIAVRDDVVESVGFVTDGCGTSRAAGSMTACLAAGQDLDRATVLSQFDVLRALGGFPQEAQHCAELSARTLRAACADHLERGQHQPDASPVKIAIPLTAKCHLARHFGRCEQFALVTIEAAMAVTVDRDNLTPPLHEPELWPIWLAEQGVQVVIANSVGRHALEILAERGIEVFTGAPAGTVDELIAAWLTGQLASGPNDCEH